VDSYATGATEAAAAGPVMRESWDARRGCVFINACPCVRDAPAASSGGGSGCRSACRVVQLSV